MADKTLDQLFEEGRLDRNVLESLLVFSTEDARYKINTSKERILRSVAGGVLRYAGCNDEIYSYEDVGDLINYIPYVSRRIQMHEKNLEKLQSRLTDSFKRLFKTNSRTGCTGGTETAIELYYMIPEFIKLSSGSVISLPYAFVDSVNKKSKGTFSKEELEQLHGIAREMGSFMRGNNDYARKNYYR